MSPSSPQAWTTLLLFEVPGLALIPQSPQSGLRYLQEAMGSFSRKIMTSNPRYLLPWFFKSGNTQYILLNGTITHPSSRSVSTLIFLKFPAFRVTSKY